MTTRRTATPPGTVTFVGAGPGDAGLLTLRAADTIATAGVLVAEVAGLGDVLAGAGPDTEIVDVTGQDPAACAKAVVTAARTGRDVARVMAGDPTVLGGYAEEADACAKAKLSVELVPGVSCAYAVPAYAGIPVTDRKVHEVQVVDLGAAAPAPDWSALAASRGTVVLLAGDGELAKAATALVEHGRRADTAIAVTAAGTTTSQRTVVSTLDAVEKDAAVLTGSLVAVVGDVVRNRDRLSWWETKPLFGWRVLVPRTKEQARSLSRQLEGYGAVPVEVPTIAVEPPRTPQAMDRAIAGLVSGRYAWVALTSANAARAIRDKVQELGLDARALAGVRVACVGDQTAAVVADWGITADLVPAGEQSSVGLLEGWPAHTGGLDALDRVLLPRADIATETLAAGLVERGWQVDDVTAYRTVRAAPPAADIREAIKTGGIDAVLFTSSSTVRNLVGIAGKPHASTVIAAIGPRTVETAEELGLRVDVVADTPSAAALAAGLAEFGAARRADGETLPPGKANRARLAPRAKKSR